MDEQACHIQIVEDNDPTDRNLFATDYLLKLFQEEDARAHASGQGGAGGDLHNNNNNNNHKRPLDLETRVMELIPQWKGREENGVSWFCLPRFICVRI